MRLWYVFHEREVKAALRRAVDRIERREIEEAVADAIDPYADWYGCECEQCNWDEHEDWIGYAAAMQLSAEPS